LMRRWVWVLKVRDLSMVIPSSLCCFVWWILCCLCWRCGIRQLKVMSLVLG
jgi:hypothetical protein